MEFRYYNNCINWSNSELESLDNLIDNEKEISYQELIKFVSEEVLDETFPMYRDCPLTLEKDWSVRFFKSKLNGEECYMVRHSAIEYVFTKIK